jgi:hypothetical protein
LCFTGINNTAGAFIASVIDAFTVLESFSGVNDTVEELLTGGNEAGVTHTFKF